MIMGTSTCHIMLGDEEKLVPGMCGAVEDGVVPGLIGFEAGQSCVGDHFDWFVKNCLPESYAAEAQRRGLVESRVGQGTFVKAVPVKAAAPDKRSIPGPPVPEGEPSWIICTVK